MNNRLQKQIDFIRDVIDNEHGGEVFDGEEYFTPDWDAIKAHIGYAIMKLPRNIELVREKTK